MGLFKPAYETDNPNKKDKAIASLSKVTSDQELAVIYKKVPLDEVAYAAFDRIKSQQVLRGLLHDHGWRKQKDHLKILARIDDIALLKDIVQEGKGKRWHEMEPEAQLPQDEGGLRTENPILKSYNASLILEQP